MSLKLKLEHERYRVTVGHKVGSSDTRDNFRHVETKEIARSTLRKWVREYEKQVYDSIFGWKRDTTHEDGTVIYSHHYCGAPNQTMLTIEGIES